MVESCFKNDKRTIDNNLTLRKNIEDAIRNSLDPLSAKKALDSLLPVLKDLSSDGGQRTRNATSRERLQQFQRQKEKGLSTRRKYDQSMTLPSIEMILSQYKRVTVHLRSVSEPMTVTEMYPRQCPIPLQSRKTEEVSSRRIRNLDQKLIEDLYDKQHSKEASYNVDAAVSLLQMERKSRKSNFSGFWDWKIKESRKISDVDNSRNDLEKCSSKNQLEKEIENYMEIVQGGTAKRDIENSKEKERRRKMERINRMKVAYCSQGDDLDDHDNLVVDSIEEQINPFTNTSGEGNEYFRILMPNYITHESKLPLHNKQIIKDDNDDIPKSDLLAISKYFMIDDDDDMSDSSTPNKIVKKMNGSESKANEYTETRPETFSSAIFQSSCLVRDSNQNSHIENAKTNNENIHNYNNCNVLYNLDPIIINEIKRKGVNNKDYDYPHSYSKFSPPILKPSSSIKLNPITSVSTNNSNEKNELIKKNSNFKDLFYDGCNANDIDEPCGRDTDSPDVNDYYLGGVDGLLDWTKSLDLDI